MDYLEQAKILYRKRHNHASNLTPNDHANLALSITKLIRSSLTQQGGVSSFKYLPFISVIQRTVGANCFQGNQAAMAFTELEKYLLLLLSQPWKREYWLLKTYGGFFRTKVKAHLDKPEEVLELVGYMQDGESSPSNCLILYHPPDMEVVLNVAFDCQVATEECLFIGEYYDKMKCVGLSLSEAMSVVLSGTPTDPAPPFPVAALQGKSNNNVLGVQSDLARQKGALRDLSQTAGAPGRGSSPGTNSVHQVTGVPAAHPVLGLQSPHVAPGFTPMPQPAPYTYQNTVELQPGFGLKADVQQLHPTVGVGAAGFHQIPGSRASYASAVSAQSSGYASGSVMGTPSSAYGGSSAFSVSSGFPNSSHPHIHLPAPGYQYTVARHAQDVGDQVDSPPVTAQPAHPVSPRHSRQLSLPQRSPADFPYIDDDDAAPSPVFPEATHEEHLQKSFLNFQGESGRGQGGPMVPATVEAVRQGVGAREGVAESFDEWRRAQKNPGSGAVPHGRSTSSRSGGVLPGRSTSLGSGGVGHPSSGMVHRPSQQSSEMTRFPPSQPATAVTALLNSASTMNDKQKNQGGDYPPLSVVGNGLAMGTREKQTKSSSGNMYDGSVLQSGEPQPQPVYYPHDSSRLPFQSYSNQVTSGASQSQKAPTFAQMAAASKRSDSRALLSRQAQGSPTAEKGQLAKSVISSARSGSGSSSEVIMRENMSVKSGSLRGSSLVTPAQGSSAQGQGFSRQSSQSMDLGMLTWRCRACTMENSVVETICSACSKSRNAPDLKFPAAGESKRMCPVCTYENPPGSSVCEMCSNALSDVHTYV